jgi:hypothetical protein
MSEPAPRRIPTESLARSTVRTAAGTTESPISDKIQARPDAVEISDLQAATVSGICSVDGDMAEWLKAAVC